MEKEELKISLKTPKQLLPLMYEKMFRKKVLTSIFRPDIYAANNV